MEAEVNEQELLEAVRKVLRVGEVSDGMTAQEIADGLGVCASTARLKIKVLLEQGVMENCRVARKQIDGRTKLVSGFRLA